MSSIGYCLIWRLRSHAFARMHARDMQPADRAGDTGDATAFSGHTTAMGGSNEASRALGAGLAT